MFEVKIQEQHRQGNSKSRPYVKNGFGIKKKKKKNGL